MTKSSFFSMEIGIRNPFDSKISWEVLRIFKTNMGFRQLREHRTTNPAFKQTIISRSAPEDTETRFKRLTPRKFYNMRKRHIDLDAIEICEERQDH